MGWFDDAVKSFNPLSAVGDIIGAGGNIIGAKMSADAAQWNTRKQLEWEREKFAKETELANTEVQRRVKDLEAAGLNKIFATGQGASVPTAGSINPSMPDYNGIGRAAEALGHGINTAFDVDLKRKQMTKMIENITAQKLKTEAETASMLDDMKPGRLKDQTIAKLRKDQEFTEKQLTTEDFKQRNIAAQIAYEEIKTAIANKDLNYYDGEKWFNYIMRVISFGGLGLVGGMYGKQALNTIVRSIFRSRNKIKLPKNDSRQIYKFTKNGVVDMRTGELLPTTFD